jgi:hypothetical protein
MPRGRNLFWFEWLGVVSLGLALILFFFAAWIPDPSSPPRGVIPAQGLWTLFLQGVGLVIGAFGLLLALVRPLLALQWWYSWAPMLALAIILYVARDAFCDECCHLNFGICAFFSVGGAMDLGVLSLVLFVAQLRAPRP